MVVGGGPAGSATAFFLAQAGARVILLDRAHFPRDKPCAEYLSPQAARILAAMGVERDIVAAGAAKLQGMIVRAPDGSTLRGDFVAAHGYRGFRDCGLAIRRTTLDNLLLSRARDAGAEVREGERVSALTRDARGRVCGVTGGSRSGVQFTVRAPVVVGADGLNSIVATQAQLNRRDPWPHRIAIVTHFENVGEISDWGEMHVDRNGYLGIAKVGATEVNVALVVPQKRAREIHGDLKGFLSRWIAERPYLARRFENARMLDGVSAAGPFARRARRAWAPGVVLTGDAADFFDPFTGEGIYTALRGGELLATHLLKYGSASQPDEELARYAAARRSEFGGKLLVERIVGMAVSFPPLINRAAAALSRRKDMADLLIGVTGDFVPAREVLRARYLLGLIIS